MTIHLHDLAPPPIAFTIPAIPIAQPRQRHAMIGGHVRNYTPSKHPVNDFKATARMAAAQAYQGPPLEGPLSLSIVFVFPRTKGEIWKRRPMPRIPHAKKPDRDNCEKALSDALRGLLFVDDAQICAGEVTKWIAAGDEQPHVEVTLSPRLAGTGGRELPPALHAALTAAAGADTPDEGERTT